jgi:hypothetical protein
MNLDLTNRAALEFRDTAENCYELESMINLRDSKNKPVGSPGIDIDNVEEIHECARIAGVDINKLNNLLIAIEENNSELSSTVSRLMTTQRRNMRELRAMLKARNVIK